MALLALATFNLRLLTAHAQKTMFTYHGRLNDGGISARGLTGFQFALFAVPFLAPSQTCGTLVESKMISS
jgi:hypothetical protein